MLAPRFPFYWKIRLRFKLKWGAITSSIAIILIIDYQFLNNFKLHKFNKQKARNNLILKSYHNLNHHHNQFSLHHLILHQINKNNQFNYQIIITNTKNNKFKFLIIRPVMYKIAPYFIILMTLIQKIMIFYCKMGQKAKIKIKIYNNLIW